MNLYLDASALVKRYVDEPESDAAVALMDAADRWFACRIGFVETMRAVSLAAGPQAAERVRREWPSFGVFEVDQELAESAARLAIHRGLRSLDAMHLAAALLLPKDGLVLATWDKRLHEAARREQIEVFPTSLG